MRLLPGFQQRRRGVLLARGLRSIVHGIALWPRCSAAGCDGCRMGGHCHLGVGHPRPVWSPDARGDARQPPGPPSRHRRPHRGLPHTDHVLGARHGGQEAAAGRLFCPGQPWLMDPALLWHSDGHGLLPGAGTRCALRQSHRQRVRLCRVIDARPLLPRLARPAVDSARCGDLPWLSGWCALHRHTRCAALRRRLLRRRVRKRPGGPTFASDGTASGARARQGATLPSLPVAQLGQPGRRGDDQATAAAAASWRVRLPGRREPR
mmetsp:Transcript_27918/g.71325  ORF Transcript_27918/g.71325 Transcript_27918/m.71325 type:complete len:264 (-) Transcript_27918:1282-2073(-)